MGTTVKVHHILFHKNLNINTFTMTEPLLVLLDKDSKTSRIRAFVAN